MDGKKADMVFTDPPYGINIVSGGKVSGDKSFGSVGTGNIVKTKNYPKIIGDNSTEYAKLFYNICVGLGIENFIIWGGNYFTDFLYPSMGWIIWDKENTGNKFADCEIAWTSYQKATRLYKWLWNGMIRKGDVQLENNVRVHPTQKPVGLFQEIFNNYDFKICLDGFLGSGSTMVACQTLDRTCYGMELEPIYCQVIINRMRKNFPELEIKVNGTEYKES
jgi:site-specific DNA-methyltransferase (adenine-specific)